MTDSNKMEYTLYIYGMDWILDVQAVSSPLFFSYKRIDPPFTAIRTQDVKMGKNYSMAFDIYVWYISASGVHIYNIH